MYSIYVLYNKDKNWLYVGMTSNPTKRLVEHNRGEVKSTKARRPYKMKVLEKVEERIEARQREVYWKSGTGKEQIKELIK